MKQQPIFIIGRFRSGTSYFWHIFNQIQGFKAWYEPLHPQLLAHIKHTQPKADHVNIKDYWAAYRALEKLADYHDLRFGSERLYLTAQDSWSALRQYIDYLMTCSGEKRPVLQFNRMDFRIPWLKGFYPQAKTLYLKRNPLQLWYSQRKHIPVQQRQNESYADAYELMQWCADLTPILPFLAPKAGRHGFYRFYLLYRLSVTMGSGQADLVIDLDEDVFNSDEYLHKLKIFGLSDAQLATAHTLKSVPESYAINEDELSELTTIMTEVDCLLHESGLSQDFGHKNLAEIKKNYAGFWEKQDFNAAAVIRELNQSWHDEQFEKIQLLSTLNAMQSDPECHE